LGSPTTTSWFFAPPPARLLPLPNLLHYLQPVCSHSYLYLRLRGQPTGRLAYSGLRATRHLRGGMTRTTRTTPARRACRMVDALPRDLDDTMFASKSVVAPLLSVSVPGGYADAASRCALLDLSPALPRRSCCRTAGLARAPTLHLSPNALPPVYLPCTRSPQRTMRSLPPEHAAASARLHTLPAIPTGRVIRGSTTRFSPLVGSLPGARHCFFFPDVATVGATAHSGCCRRVAVVAGVYARRRGRRTSASSRRAPCTACNDKPYAGICVTGRNGALQTKVRGNARTHLRRIK